MNGFFRVAFAVVVVTFASAETTIEYTVAQTKLGDVRGAVRRYGNMTVREFLGIRYAQPPTGSLRFSKSLPVQPWSPRTYDALLPGSSCPQDVPASLGLDVSEDCLFLNVFAPHDASPPAAVENGSRSSTSASTATQRAVMIFVHGGRFEYGSGTQMPGSGLASVGDVVVVTINYRLGVFGFLSTGSPDSPGNYGLWDQRTAFAWVRDNIAAFGGDPTRITIFGESAGSASVSCQAISPQNDRTLFQRVIAESGSCHSPWAFQYAPLASAAGIAQRLACPTTPTATLVSCLRSKNVSELTSQASGLRWAPTVDGEFILDTPDVMMQKVLNGSRDAYLEKFSNYDYLTGFNSQEGLMFVEVSLTNPGVNDISKNLTGNDVSDGLKDQVYTYAIKLIGQYNYADGAAVALFVDYVKLLYETIYRQELGSHLPDARDKLRLFVQISGDFNFVAPTMLAVDLHAALKGGGKRYQYLYDVRSSSDELSTDLGKRLNWLRVGANHAEELLSVFASPFLEGQLSDGSSALNSTQAKAERELSAAMIQYWTNFAKSGDPNIGRPLLKQWSAWSPYDIQNQSFLLIMINGSSVHYHAKSQERSFWNDLVAATRKLTISLSPVATSTDTKSSDVAKVIGNQYLTLSIAIVSLSKLFWCQGSE